MKIRLDKYLADMAVGTRSEVKKLIVRGMVQVNKEVIKKVDYKVDTACDKVVAQEREILYEPFLYYMMNKPAGVVSATRDERERTVIDLLDERDFGGRKKELFPAGRLDKDTEGLLLLTNDGELSHRILSPKNHVDKTYYARIEGRVTDDDVHAFLKGLEIGEKRPTLPAKLRVLASGEISEVELTIREGKFHQVKRMFEAVEKRVLYLKRIRMGALCLDESLKPGEYRRLTKEETEQLC